MNYNSSPLKDPESSADTPGIDTEEDVEIMFSSTIRALLSDIAITITQSRIDKLHKGLELPDKPTHRRQNDNGYSPFVSASRVRFQKIRTAATLLRRRVPPLIPAPIGLQTANEIFAEGVADAEGGLNRDPELTPSRGQTRYVQGSVFQTDGQPMGSEHSGTGIQNPLHQPKNTDVESLLEKYTIEEIKPRNTGFYSQFFIIHKKTEDLRPILDLLKLNIHVKKYFKMETLTSICRKIHRKDYPTSLYLHDEFMNILFRVFPLGLLLSPLGSPTSGQKATERWKNDIEMPCEVYSEGPIDVDYSAPWGTNSSPSLGAQEHRYLHSMGNCCGYPLLIWNFEPKIEGNEYHCKGATGGALFSEAQDSGEIGEGLLRKHNHTLVHQKVWKHNLLRTIEELRTDLVTLPEKQSPLPKSLPRTNHNEFGYTELEVSHIVSRYGDTANISADHTPRNNCNTNYQKRKIFTLEKQAPVLDVFEDQWRSLETQGLGTYVVDFIISSDRRVRRRLRYNSIQQRFLD
ncbi:hypothetical protein AYI69_g4655 [Smittium culicis]|uniref:Uncharacterized protein n=1 Tax=Smittium culicis TaxID=133412 RepID=A0A1R1YBW7_9FUNG|nr:hypothetical protein AYI69_g4655 [Smittium culicis]